MDAALRSAVGQETVTTEAPAGYDIVVRVHAVSINPIDFKLRASKPGEVLGYDASGGESHKHHATQTAFSYFKFCFRFQVSL